MLRRFLLVLAVFAVLGCSEGFQSFEPPFLAGAGGLAGVVEIVPPALVMGESRPASMPDSARFSGFLFGTGEPATVQLELSAADHEVRSEIALYGPRDARGLFGAARFFSAGEGKAGLFDVSLDGAGEYLVLARVAGGAGVAFALSYDCSAGCATSSCPVRLCGNYCPSGFVFENGCPTCQCAVGCTSDAGCALGFVCRDGMCQAEDPCSCPGEQYVPVCGADGRTYANACRLACAGVALQYTGPCHSECSVDADCPAGMACLAGLCRAACACEGEPYQPVCGTDRRTYANLCELRCAGAALAFACRCDAYLPSEICGNGLDDDCDGLVDEGCGASCASDADCAANEFCAGGTCIPGSACATDADCPAGQVCQAGTCRLPSGCQAEACDGIDNDCDGMVDEGCAACRADSDCASGQSCCAGRCVDVQNDRANCGRCGNACGAGEECQSGLCRTSCEDRDGDGYCASVDCDDADASINPGAAEICGDRLDNDCDGFVDEGCGVCVSDADCAAGQSCCDGVCLDLSSDPENCGGCGMSCAAGQGCGGGWCTARCSSDNDCEAGQACLDGLCRIYCRLDSDCLSGQMCLNNLCVRQP
ncbi:MAG: hypothetical protein GYA21_08590 [Myxococcales bacterium]|nr:hypothetical protein [Myxococcales bacterium]